MSPQEKILNPVGDIQETSKKSERKVQMQAQLEEAASPQVLVSHTDAHIHERMKAQPKDLKEVEIHVRERSRDLKHQLSLPEELEPFEKKYRFRWLMKTKRAIDWACDVRGWSLLNRSYFPDLPRYLFTVNGSVERGDTILAFMPQTRAEELARVPGQRSSEIIKSQFEKHQGNPNFYVPKDDETREVIGI